MYRTKIGLEFMDFLAKKANKIMKFLGYAGIVVGFLGMILLGYSLLDNLYDIFTKPEAPPGVGLVLPFEAKGVVFVPFFYWIISIFIIALIHEYAHGVIARAHNIKVKSSGFAFLGSSSLILGILMVLFTLPKRILNSEFSITSLSLQNDFVLVFGASLVLLSLFKNLHMPIIPAAFVEPDEKVLRKRSVKQQLSVFAAGPFSNILLAFLVLALSAFILAPIGNNMMELDGVEITGFIKGDYPAEKAGIAEGEIVKEIDGAEVGTLDDFSEILAGKNPGTNINLKTDKSQYNLILASNPEDELKSYLGVYVQQEASVKEAFSEKYGKFIPVMILWVAGLFKWLIILNLGIGLFNLVPIGPLDGGRMMQLALHKFFNKKKADKIWHHTSMVFLFIVLANILAAFIK